MQSVEGLEEIQAKQQAQRQEQYQKSEAAFLEGMQKLKQFQDQGCKDFKALEAALQAFIQSMEYNRHNPEPYLAMGHVHLLIEDKPMALKYFQEAQSLQPENSEIQALIDLVVEQRFGSGAYGTPDVLSTQDLYHAAESLIAKTCQDLTLRLQKPTVSMEVINEVEDFMDVLEESRADIEDFLLKIGDTLDTQALREALQPIDEAIAQQEAIILQSYTLMDLVQESKYGLIKAQEYLHLLQKQEADAQALVKTGLEHLQELRQKLADQTRALEREGFDVVDVEQDFNQFVLALEQLEDSLDSEVF